MPFIAKLPLKATAKSLLEDGSKSGGVTAIAAPASATAKTEEVNIFSQDIIMMPFA